jgi:hypothetical protein
MGYNLITFRDLKMERAKKPFLLLRHDVDFSLERSLTMANLEARENIRSTYFVLMTSPLYSLFSEEGIRALAALARNHEIGYHFDRSFLGDLSPEEGLRRELRILEHHIGNKIHAFAEHNPISSAASLKLRGYVNAYSLESIKYLSDSVQNWREGCFCLHLGQHDKIQVLVHPEWWTATGSERRKILNKMEHRMISNLRRLYRGTRRMHAQYLRRVVNLY